MKVTKSSFYTILYIMVMSMTITFLSPVKTQSQESNTGTISIQQLWKSQAFNFSIQGIAIGDVNNDNKTDILILTKKNIQMYNYEDGKINKVSDIYKIRLIFPIGIDIADINKNGFPEIFVTAFDMYKKSITSFVIEYDGKEFKPIAKNLSWYLRAVKLKDNIPVLFGQKHVKKAPFKGKRYEMKWDKSKYIPCKEILSSINVNVMGLAYGDIMNNGQNAVVAYDEFNNIIMLDSNGEQTWESSEKYGGSTFYYQHEGESPASEGEREYLPMRIQICDINSDGIYEIIAVKNYGFARNMFDKFRLYRKHHIALIKWDGISFNTYCETGIIYGFVRDFAISDLNNDGKKELITVLIIKEGKTIFRKPECYLTAYNID